MIQKNGFDPVDLIPPDSEHSWGTWEEKAALHPFASPSPCLLLVEADAGWQTFLKLALSEEGYALQVASSLEHALAQASMQTFDLVLVHLPDDSPRQLLKTMKSLRE